MRKIVLCGARGQLGRAFQDFFKTQDVEVALMYWDSFQPDKLKDALAGADFLINCAAFSDDSESYKHPYKVFQTNVMGVVKQLEIIRQWYPQVRYVTFGSVYEGQDSPYACSKVCSREVVRCYREMGLWAAQVTLGHVEYVGGSEKRLAQRIVRAAAKIAAAVRDNWPFETLVLHNVDEGFKFCWAGDVVKVVWGLLQEDYPKEPLLEGELVSLADFTRTVFDAASLGPCFWRGNSRGWRAMGNVNLTFVEEHLRLPSKVKVSFPIQVDNPEALEKLYEERKWKPTTTTQQMIEKLVQYEQTKTTAN